MGKILEASCTCTFNQKVTFGAGKNNFETVCYVPALDKEIGSMEEMNILDNNLRKENYAFYDQKEMYESMIDENEFEEENWHYWSSVILSAHNNLCPKCKTYQMNFEVVSRFD